MKVDLVVAPVRYPRTPLLALLVIAVAPAIALFALYRWSDAEADRDDAEQLTAAASEPAVAPVDDGGPIAPVLRTGLFEYRRIPESLSDLADADRLADALVPVLTFVGGQSCAAVSVEGVPVAAKNPDLPLIPASTQKLVIASVALEVLGADFRFTTRVAAPAPVDGVVDGDIYLIGGGDPVLTSDDYPIDDDGFPAINTTSLDRLADAVVASGITRIDGTVVGDGTRYDDEFAVPTWAPGIAGADAGPYDALLANDARVLGRSGRQSDPNEGAAREFVRLLGNRGVRVNNGWGSGTADPTVPVIGSVDSAPLPAIVNEMLATSDNNTAELLLKEIGFAARGEGTRTAGIEVVSSTLLSWGIPSGGVRLVDGSGLGVENRLTCAALLAILQRERGGPVDAGLPVAAMSGTLQGEFTESPMAGRLRAKTGTLSNPPFDQDPPAAKALAGYVDTGVPETIEFVLILNTPDVTEERRFAPLWTALGDQLATFPSGPSMADLGPDLRPR